MFKKGVPPVGSKAAKVEKKTAKAPGELPIQSEGVEAAPARPKQPPVDIEEMGEEPVTEPQMPKVKTPQKPIRSIAELKAAVQKKYGAPKNH